MIMATTRKARPASNQFPVNIRTKMAAKVAGKNLIRLPMIRRMITPTITRKRKPASIHSSMIIARP